MKPIRSIPTTLALALTLALPLGARWLATPRSAPAVAASALPAAPAPEQLATLLVESIIQVESGGDARKVGRHGERGLMQIKANTWQDMTTRLFGAPLPFDQAFDPALNRRVGTAYLAFLQQRILPRQAEWKADERALLLAAYNAGPGRLRRSGFDLARMPRQTRDYVERASALHDAFLGDMAASVRAKPRTHHL
jgi:soluble lytic murein transglycosylase-like protein